MKKKLLCLLMPACLIGLVACQNSTVDNNTTNNTEVVTETQTETETEKETKITKNREIYNSDITYETLVRYPDKNINSALKFSGNAGNEKSVSHFE
jgi:ABC-type glycerol-3-phosphate transport system substrate-binding protein